jgi:dipeptidase E
MKKKIVTIGGGAIKTSGKSIDKEIIRLLGEKSPYFLFIPTASSDSEKYWEYIDHNYGEKLGCKTDVLYLLREELTRSEIKKKIMRADIIYVGGGNTLKMMRLWRRLGVDKMLKEAWHKGKVLCGISAGSICWFDSGHSDSMSFYNPKKWKYINVKGLGFIKGIHCPHYDSKTLGIPRKHDFMKMMQKTKGIGIALDENCAIIFIDDGWKVITSTNNANAYRIYKKNGKVISEKLKRTKKFLPTKDLYSSISST